jgi:hypothetical protein
MRLFWQTADGKRQKENTKYRLKVESLKLKVNTTFCFRLSPLGFCLFLCPLPFAFLAYMFAVCRLPFAVCRLPTARSYTFLDFI